jgi:hypothetical protein
LDFPLSHLLGAGIYSKGFQGGQNGVDLAVGGIESGDKGLKKF